MAKTEGLTSSNAAPKYSKAPVRLWVKAKFLGFRRNRVVQQPGQALLKLEGVNDSDATRFYFGKRVVYIYKAEVKTGGSKFRTIWGRISRAHGKNGVVLAKFNPNLPARAMGATVRVMLYPNRTL